MTPARVFVVASTPMMRAGLRSMLAAAEGVEVVGAANPATASEPSLHEADVLLAADDDSLDAAALALADDGTQALVLVSEDGDAAPRLRTLPLRGWAVVPPETSPEELGAAISAAASGLAALARPLAERLLGEPATVEELSEPLTAREREVLGLLGRGFSNRAIAGELHISEHTVKFHVSSLYAKLGVNNRTEAVSQGARHGLISL